MSDYEKLEQGNVIEPIYAPLALSLAALWRACINGGVVPAKALEDATAQIHAINSKFFGDAPVTREIADIIAGKLD